jgi:hypothetical protein
MKEKRENQLSRLYMQVRELSLIALIVIEIALIGVFTHLPSPRNHKPSWVEYQTSSRSGNGQLQHPGAQGIGIHARITAAPLMPEICQLVA